MKARQGYKKVYDFFENEFLIPDKWEYPKFNEIVKTNPPTKIEGKTVPYIPMDSVDTENPSFNYTEERLLSENQSLSKFQDNYVLFARITPSTENGKTSFVENFKKKGIVSTELTVLRPSEKVFPKYLYYYIKSHKIRQFAISQMMGTTGRQRVPDFVFKKDLHFELPPLPEQQKIASILSNVDAQMQQTQKLIDLTQRLKNGLMQNLLTRGIGHTKFKKVKGIFRQIEEIPEQWDYVELEKLTPNKKSSVRMGPFGSSLKKEELVEKGIMTLWIENIVNNEFSWDYKRYITEEKFQELKGFKVNPDDVLITMMGTTGKVAIVPKDIGTAIITSHLLKITLDQKKCLPKFLYYFLRSNFIHRQILRESRGIVMGGLNTKIIKSLLIKAPQLIEQQKIASILSNVDEQINQHKNEKALLERIKKGLMQQLLTGQRRVKVGV